MIFQIQIYQKQTAFPCVILTFYFFLTLLLKFYYFHCRSHHVSFTNLENLFNPRFLKKMQLLQELRSRSSGSRTWGEDKKKIKIVKAWTYRSTESLIGMTTCFIPTSTESTMFVCFGLIWRPVNQSQVLPYADSRSFWPIRIGQRSV